MPFFHFIANHKSCKRIVHLGCCGRNAILIKTLKSNSG